MPQIQKHEHHAGNFLTLLLAVIVIFSLLLGSILLLSIKKSVPGDFFYSLKRGAEAIYSSTGPNPDTKIRASLVQSDERMQEIAALMAKTDARRVLKNGAATSNRWEWVDSDSNNSMLGTISQAVNATANQLAGKKPQTKEDIMSEVQSLFVEYTSSVEIVNENFEKMASTTQSSEKLEEAQQVGFEITEYMIYHRGFLERISTVVDDNTIIVIESAFLSIDKTDKNALLIMSHPMRNKLVHDVKVFNPNVQKHIENLIAIDLPVGLELEASDNKSLSQEKVDANVKAAMIDASEPQRVEPIKIGVGPLGIEAVSVTGLEVKKD